MAKHSRVNSSTTLLRGHLSLTHRTPWLIAFGFGLLHGLRFAGALSEIGLPAQEVPLALLFFNIGVELGQLMFVTLVLAGFWFWHRFAVSMPHWSVLVPAYALGVIATYFSSVQRRSSCRHEIGRNQLVCVEVDRKNDLTGR